MQCQSVLVLCSFGVVRYYAVFVCSGIMQCWCGQVLCSFGVFWYYEGWCQYVVFTHWKLCCPVGYVERGGGLTFRDRLNSSENYLLLGFLLAIPSQTVLLLVRQSVT